MMKIGEINVGMADRVIRLIAGLVFIGAFALNMVADPWVYLVGLVGVIALITGAVGTCPLYSVLGINTLGKKDDHTL
jgi:hypothetical protein